MMSFTSSSLTAYKSLRLLSKSSLSSPSSSSLLFMASSLQKLSCNTIFTSSSSSSSSENSNTSSNTSSNTTSNVSPSYQTPKDRTPVSGIILSPTTHLESKLLSSEPIRPKIKKVSTPIPDIQPKIKGSSSSSASSSSSIFAPNNNNSSNDKDQHQVSASFFQPFSYASDLYMKRAQDAGLIGKTERKQPSGEGEYFVPPEERVYHARYSQLPRQRPRPDGTFDQFSSMTEYGGPIGTVTAPRAPQNALTYEEYLARARKRNFILGPLLMLMVVTTCM